MESRAGVGRREEGDTPVSDLTNERIAEKRRRMEAAIARHVRVSHTCVCIGCEDAREQIALLAEVERRRAQDLARTGHERGDGHV